MVTATRSLLVSRTFGAAAALGALLVMAACAQPLDDHPWLIDAPRIIAVTASPPEAAPGARVVLAAVVAGRDGAASSVEVRWAPCAQPRPFSQNESINTACLATLAGAPVGEATFTLDLARDVCATFGPDAPSGGIRPRDADSTGGYFQPVGVELDGAATFASVRLSCEPAGVSADVARAWAAAARPNANPTFTLSASVAGAGLAFDALPAGAAIDLSADWSATPEETYAFIDPANGTLQTGVERYDVSWFATTGALSPARSIAGRGRWQLPSAPGAAMLWGVLRDSRGGVAVQAVRASWR